MSKDFSPKKIAHLNDVHGRFFAKIKNFSLNCGSLILQLLEIDTPFN